MSITFRRKPRVKRGAKYLSAKRTADLACGFSAGFWLPFRDDIESHQDAQVLDVLQMVAVEDHAVQQCHYGMLSAFDNTSTPVMEHLVGVVDLGPKLGATAKLVMGDLEYLPGGDQHSVKVDELGTGDNLPDSVLHIQRYSLLAIALCANGEGQALASGSVHFGCGRTVKMNQRIAGSVEDRVADKARYPERIAEYQHGQRRVHVPFAGPDQSQVVKLAVRQAAFGRLAHAM